MQRRGPGNAGSDPILDSHLVFLVRRGRIQVWRDADHLKVELTEEEGRPCLLTLQDGIDLAFVFGKLGMQMFQEHGVPPDWRQQVVQDDLHSFVWTLGAGQLRLFYREAESEFLQVSYSGKEPLRLSVGHVTEVAQVLENFVLRAREGG